MLAPPVCLSGWLVRALLPPSLVLASAFLSLSAGSASSPDSPRCLPVPVRSNSNLPRQCCSLHCSFCSLPCLVRLCSLDYYCWHWTCTTPNALLASACRLLKLALCRACPTSSKVACRCRCYCHQHPPVVVVLVFSIGKLVFLRSPSASSVHPLREAGRCQSHSISAAFAAVLPGRLSLFHCKCTDSCPVPHQCFQRPPAPDQLLHPVCWLACLLVSHAVNIGSA